MRESCLHAQGGSLCKDAKRTDFGAQRSCDPCGCTLDFRSGGVKVPFNGCADHHDRGLNGRLWCFVSGGSACKAASADPLIPGAAWRQCTDQQCQCVTATGSTQEWSGVAEVKPSELGCKDHDSRGYSWCWVRAGIACRSAEPAADAIMRTAAWQPCNVSACACITDSNRSKPDETIPVGCASHFSKADGSDGNISRAGLEVASEICYVSGGVGCTQEGITSDHLVPTAAWRSCKADCYGQGASFAPETSALCSCFREPRRGTRRHRTLQERSGICAHSVLCDGAGRVAAGGW